MSKICYIVGAGELSECKIQPKKDDFVIAADGGYLFLEKEGISIDLIVGDFDSLGYIPKHNNVKKFPCEKDETDMMIAIQEGMDRGYEEFKIYGGLGGRLSHTLANIQLLSYLANNGKIGYLIDKQTVMTVIRNNKLRLEKQNSQYISIFSVDQVAKGVTITGLKYTLHNGSLSNDIPLGVSNEFQEEQVEIIVDDGSLCIIWEHLL